MSKLELRVTTSLMNSVADYIMDGARNVSLRAILVHTSRFETIQTLTNGETQETEFVAIREISGSNNKHELTMSLFIDDSISNIISKRPRSVAIIPTIEEIFDPEFLDGDIYVQNSTVAQNLAHRKSGAGCNINLVADYKGKQKTPKKAQKMPNTLFLLHGTGMLRDPNTDELLPIYKASGQVGIIEKEYRKRVEELMQPFIEDDNIPNMPDGVVEILLTEYPMIVGSWIVASVNHICSNLQWVSIQSNIDSMEVSSRGQSKNTVSKRYTQDYLDNVVPFIKSKKSPW